MPTRRHVLFSSALLVPLAGCSGGPDHPSDVLPAESDRWTRGDTTEMMPIEAESGVSAEYVGSETDEYYLEILRWESQSEAENGVSGYEDWGWPVYAVKSEFSFAVYIDKIKSKYTAEEYDKMYALLSNSPYLTEEYVREHNMMDATASAM